MKKIVFTLSIILSGIFSFAQNQNLNYKEFDLDGNKKFLSSIELSPDAKTLAISTGGGPVFFWDIETQKIIRTIEVNGYPWGPNMTYSNNGKYILLEQQFYTDWRINRDRPNRAEILDVTSGKILVTRNGVHSAALTPDNKSLITLEDGTIYFWNIVSGTQERKFTPPNITYSVAISPDGNTLVVSQKPTEADLKNIPSIREDKKAIKEAIKLQEVAIFYDAKTFAYKFIATDIFDIVFSMRFSPDGSSLYLFNAPNRKRISPGQGGASRHGYIQVVNPQNGEVSRVIFPTNAPTPTFKESTDGKYFATTSIEQKFYVFTSVALFDRASGNMLKNFQNDFRLMENTHNGKSAVEFLPDKKTIALGYGYKLALWNFAE